MFNLRKVTRHVARAGRRDVHDPRYRLSRLRRTATSTRPTSSKTPTAVCSSSTPAAGTSSVARRRSSPSRTCSARSTACAAGRCRALADPRGTQLALGDDVAPQTRGAARRRAAGVRARGDGQLAKIGRSGAVLRSPTLQRSARSATAAQCRVDADPHRRPAARAAVRGALEDRDASVRQAAVHSVALARRAARPALIATAQRDRPALQRAAAEALGRIGDRSPVPALLGATAAAADRSSNTRLIYALIEIGDAPARAAALGSAIVTATRRAALIALDQMDGGGLAAGSVAPLLDSPDRSLKDTAWWIAARHPQWGGGRRALENGADCGVGRRTRAGAPARPAHEIRRARRRRRTDCGDGNGTGGLGAVDCVADDGGHHDEAAARAVDGRTPPASAGSRSRGDAAGAGGGSIFRPLRAPRVVRSRKRC